MDAARSGSSSEVKASNLPLTEDASYGTRLYTLLHSNEPPNDSEIPFLRCIASEMSGRLAWLDDEVSRLWDRWVELTAERTTLAQSHENHQRVLSPVRSLPSEILGEIFAWTLPTVAEASGRTMFQLQDSPWNLTHVCSRWRAIAVATRSLWSLLVLPYAKYCYPKEAAEMQLQRTQLLKIHFMGSNATLGCLPCQIEMLEYLIQHSPRWEEFAATTLTEELYPLLRDLSNQVPALRKVLLHWVDEDAEEAMDNVDFIQTAGSLVEVDILRRHDTISFTPPTNRLTRYYVNAPWEVHQQLLSMNTTLVEAHIDVHPEEPDWTTIDGNIEMPQLRCLYVSHAELLAHLTVPNLEQLTLEFGAGEVGVIPVLDKFFADSSNNIRRLGLRGAPGAHLTEQVLLRLPLLTELVILVYAPSDDDDSDSDGNLLELNNPAIELLPALSNPALSPRLSRFHLAFEAPMRFNYELLHDMVKSRLDGGAPLEAVSIVFEEDNTCHSAMPVSMTQHGLDMGHRKCANVLEYMAEWMCASTWTRFIPY